MIKIKNSAYGKGHYCVYSGANLLATVCNEKPNTANNRVDNWSISWVTGRVDWFESQKEMRDCALKGI